MMVAMRLWGLMMVGILGAAWASASLAHDPKDLLKQLHRLQQAYPDHIVQVSEQAIVWADGTVMKVHQPSDETSPHDSLKNASLADQLALSYPVGPETWNSHATEDPGRSRYDPFFRTMYGASQDEVRRHLVTIFWMPQSFGTQYPLLVTRVNGVHLKLQKISEELDALPDALKVYLKNPGGTFCWRTIASTHRISPHSFGMTLDINTDFSHYWQWDYKKAHKLPHDAYVSEDVPLTFQNLIPWEIVAIFEKYGFVWGGKWRHYDTMHFEYRPELFPSPSRPGRKKG